MKVKTENKMNHIIETAKVTIIGTGGTWFTLINMNEVIGVIVGVLTATYLFVKIYYLIKNKGK